MSIGKNNCMKNARALNGFNNTLKQRMLNAQELADQLKCARGTIYKLVKRGRLPHMRLGSDFRFDLAKVMEALEGRNNGKAQG